MPFDSELDSLCAFESGSDGRYRCMPSHMSASFTDAACVEPIGVDGPSSSCPRVPPKYILVGEHLRVRGEKWATPPSELFHLLLDGSCVRATVAPDVDRYAAGPEITTELVEGRKVQSRSP